MSKIILVHGAGHNATCWEKTIPLLAAAGHEILAIDLPGRTGSSDKPYKLHLQKYISTVIEAAEKFGGDVTVVAHSMGGIFVTAACCERPELFERVIYLSAIIPGPEVKRPLMALFTCTTSRMVLATRANLIKGTAWFAPRLAAGIFYTSDESLQRSDIYKYLSVEAFKPLMEKIRVNCGTLDQVEMHYIECTEDRAVPIESQRRLQKQIRLESVITINTDHSPFATAPDTLMTALSTAMTTGECNNHIEEVI